MCSESSRGRGCGVESGRAAPAPAGWSCRQGLGVPRGWVHGCRGCPSLAGPALGLPARGLFSLLPPAPPPPRVLPADRPSGPSCPHQAPSGASPTRLWGGPGLAPSVLPSGGPSRLPCSSPRGPGSLSLELPRSRGGPGPGELPAGLPVGVEAAERQPLHLPGRPLPPPPAEDKPSQSSQGSLRLPPRPPAAPSPLWGFLGSWVWGACPVAPAAPWPCSPRWALVARLAPDLSLVLGGLPGRWQPPCKVASTSAGGRGSRSSGPCMRRLVVWGCPVCGWCCPGLGGPAAPTTRRFMGKPGSR